jgi:hypothetical protein
MADLRRTPSLQHAVALIADTVPGTVRNMRKLDAARIEITLNPGRALFKPMMEGFGLPWALRQLEGEKPHNVAPNKDLVSAFAPYAEHSRVPWFRECDMIGYPIGPNIVMPVRPAGFWPTSGRLRVLWVQSWKGRTLDPLQRAIFATILRETFFVGDFKTAKLDWVDLRAQTPRGPRCIEELDGDLLGSITREELAEYLSILLEAFRIFKAEKDKARAEVRAAAREEARRNPPPAGPLFDDEPGVPPRTP